MRELIFSAALLLTQHAEAIQVCASLATQRAVPAGVAPELAVRLAADAVPLVSDGRTLGLIHAVVALEPGGDAASPYPSSAPRYFHSLAPGSLLGVLVLQESWRDARGEELPSGAYTLRYVLQPRMKDHFGTAERSDFALLIPAADDRGGAIAPDEAIALSRGAARHPRVMMLVAPPPGAIAPCICSTAARELLTVDVGGIAVALVVPPGTGEVSGP